MPTYEYECKACHRRFEKLQPITAKPQAPCPKCGKSSRRLISPGAGLLFKGSGFYATDYRSASYKKKAQNESKGSSGDRAGEPAVDRRVGEGSAGSAGARAASCGKSGCPK